MKKIYKTTSILLILCVLTSIFNSINAQEKKKSKKAKKIEIEMMISKKVDSLINSRDLVLYINETQGSDGEISYLKDGYDFDFRNNVLNCNIPYYGKSKNTSTYSSENINMNIEMINAPANVTSQKSRGATQMKINSKTDVGEEWIFYITIFNNAEFRMSAETINREKIYYSGNIKNFNLKEETKKIENQLK